MGQPHRLRLDTPSLLLPFVGVKLKKLQINPVCIVLRVVGTLDQP